ncbi:MAG: trehalose-phosphatase [Thermoleophilia bacterium]|nr:trehalose-phosphatase [Thermoleophilia bacterium]
MTSADQPHSPLGFDRTLRDALGRIARVPQLLIGCDYDGTLAPLVDDPSQAEPRPEAVAAVRALAALPQTTVAVVSGRSLRDLATLSRLPSEIHLVGSHGSEFDLGFLQSLAPELVELQSRLLTELTAIAREHEGVRVEIKPASVALHVRGVERPIGDRALDAVRCGPATWPDVQTTIGKDVIELSVVATDKGAAITTLRGRTSASAVLYLGDDVTDENAFALLHGPDVGIKIGPGETLAGHRLDEPMDAARALGFVLETRRHWLYGEHAVPIERHTMLSNGSTVALLTPDARVSWLCHPRPDSAAVFADMVGGNQAGYFSITPVRDGLPLGQRYRPGTMTVETRWPGVTVTDWLEGEVSDTGADEARAEGSTGPCSTMVRVLTGTGTVSVEFAPRPEFGQVPITLQPLEDGLLVLGSNEPITLFARGVEWEVRDDGGHDTARAVVDLAAQGGRAVIELRFGSENCATHPSDITERQARAEDPWSEWAAGLQLPATHPKDVLRSALTLRGLCHFPTGSILAAATTSLPEALGGGRNWDYRYCWLRDAAMSARALVDLGSLAEAEALLRWVDGCIERTGGHPERLHPLYTVEGLELGPEAVIDTLPGYAGSRPVRIGNAANRQIQLDVFGSITDLQAAVVARRGTVADEDWHCVEAMVTAVERRWQDPDHGIWEARLTPRHHVYSKVMCWLTVDRALQVQTLRNEAPKASWLELRDRIRADVLEHGWNEEAGAYSVAYGDPEIDASSLWVGLSGLVPDDDPRFLATVLKVEEELRSGAVVYRYRWDDGLAGSEGGFHLCTAWLVEAYVRTGRHTEAEDLFQQMLDTAGPTGLLPEQYDPVAERGLGNHPQAYSHLGVIRSAIVLGGANDDPGLAIPT